MITRAWRYVGNGKWAIVTAKEVMATKRAGERFRSIVDGSVTKQFMLRHHGGKVTPHFEVEPRWNDERG